MTLMAVSIPVRPEQDVEVALDAARTADAQGADLVEWRVDLLADHEGGHQLARALVTRSPLPCIVTCRSRAEGGLHDGETEAVLSLLESVLQCQPPPRYIDVELAAMTAEPAVRRRLHAALEACNLGRDLRTGLIVSMHDMRGRPADLLQRVQAMVEDPACDIIKVAWWARSVRDNLEAFELLASRPKPSIVLCMGPMGLASRVLAGKFGALLTFAAGQSATATAPGQPTLHRLRETFRFREIGPTTRVYGVVGSPVEHSRGPDVQNAAFEATGHDGVYLPLPVPEAWEHFKASLGCMVADERLGFAGASVTLPHKEHLVRFVRESGGVVEDGAALIGSANTLLVRRGGGLLCADTDGPAAVEALRRGMGIGPEGLSGLSVAILGAGGAARAVAGSLARAGARVVVFNRDHTRAESLIAALQAVEPGVEIGSPDRLAAGFPLIINCTSVGMTGGPAPDESPLRLLADRPVPLDGSCTVFDTVYTPRRTPLLHEAQASGARTIEGRTMFLLQAAMQFERWTSMQAPLDVMKAALGAD
jgi:3-dehydroquinate dehydratase/shikimate dehydrogenase